MKPSCRSFISIQSSISRYEQSRHFDIDYSLVCSKALQQEQCVMFNRTSIMLFCCTVVSALVVLVIPACTSVALGIVSLHHAASEAGADAI